MIISLSEILVDTEFNKARGKISRESCEGLARTIGQDGIISPITVEKIAHPEYKYKLISGYRRIMAYHILGKTEIEAYVKDDVTEENAKILNLLENIHRSDLTYWQQCKGVRDSFPEGVTELEVSKRLSMSRSWARARTYVWRLPQEVLDQVEQGLLGPTQVNVLTQKAPDEQVDAAKQMVEGMLAGESKQSVISSMTRRRTCRPKKEIQKMMVRLMNEGLENEMHCLRYAICEISDTQLLELLEI